MLAKLMDIRGVIGALFTFYGIVLIITGVLDGPAELAKADGVRINLWTGIGMLIVGVFFLAWSFLRPVVTEDPAEDPGE